LHPIPQSATQLFELAPPFPSNLETTLGVGGAEAAWCKAEGSFEFKKAVALDAENKQLPYFLKVTPNKEVWAYPDWWPVTPENHVPWDEIILTKGKCATYGLHVDTFTQPPNSVENPRFPTSILTLYAGSKTVLIVPLGKEDEIFPDKKNPGLYPTPGSPLIEKILSVGGYYFEWKPTDKGEPTTLVFPSGWWHWIEASAEFTVLATGSIFP